MAGSLSKFIQAEMLSADERFKIQRLYLKFYAVNLRHLIKSIKQQQFESFDPYICSAAIDDGLWSTHECLENEMYFSEPEVQEYFKDLFPLKMPANAFKASETNYFELVDLMTKHFQKDSA